MLSSVSFLPSVAPTRVERFENSIALTTTTTKTTNRYFPSSRRKCLCASRGDDDDDTATKQHASSLPTTKTTTDAGEPKVVYIFNSTTCAGSAELKDILGNKYVLRKVLTYLRPLTTSRVDTFFDVIIIVNNTKKMEKKTRPKNPPLFPPPLFPPPPPPPLERPIDRSMKTTTAKKKQTREVC